MNLQQAFKMAFQSILHKKGRSFLTMLGIIIGIASVMIIVSVVNGFSQKAMEYYQSMGTNKVTINANLNNGQNIYPKLQKFCQDLGDRVVGITPDMSCDATVIYGAKSSDNMEDNPPELHLGSDQYSVCNNFQINKGRDISPLDIQNYNQVCVMGAKAVKLFFDYQNPIGETIMVNGIPFTVIGTYKEKDADTGYLDDVIVFPYSANRVLGQGDGSDVGGQYIIKAKNASSVKEIINRVNGYLASVYPDDKDNLFVYSENQWMEQDNKYALMMSLVLGGIAFISLLVGGIGIMNIMLVTVTERTREIGIRRAIGAERKSIVVQFLIEASTLCGIGGLIGIIFGYLGTFAAGKLLIKMTLFPTVSITLGAFGFSVVLGILFGMYPAIKASGLQPVVALRAE